MAVLPSNSIKKTALYWVPSVEQKCSTIDLTKDFAACMQILAGWLTNWQPGARQQLTFSHASSGLCLLLRPDSDSS
jgi:hypothetical protein